jgi:hypothetical protein
MRHSPYESEYQAIKTMSDNQLLDYFMSRLFESDEVWFLHNKAGLYLRTLGDLKTCVVWPYKLFATEAALEHWQECFPSSSSLEYFMDHILDNLITQKILVDVMPRGSAAGCLIAPDRLRAILQGLIDAGEYRLDA